MLIAGIAIAGVIAGGIVFYAGLRVGVKLQWAADNEIEPFKTMPKTRTTETE